MFSNKAEVTLKGGVIVNVNTASMLVDALLLGVAIGVVSLIGWYFKLRFLEGCLWSIVGFMLFYGFLVFMAVPFLALLVSLPFGYLIYWLIRYFILPIHNDARPTQRQLRRSFSSIVAGWASQIDIEEPIVQETPALPATPQPAAPAPQPVQPVEPQVAQPTPEPFLRESVLLEALERQWQCTVVVDEHDTYVVSGPDQNRRQAAEKTLEIYIREGWIHPRTIIFSGSNARTS